MAWLGVRLIMSSVAQNPASVVVDRSAEGIKETLESVIVAFILAFVFRAFIVEAFVIPTGSMAPTLYGVHGMQTCTHCGTVYAFGLKEHPDVIRRDHPRDCPNCGRSDNNPQITPDIRERHLARFPYLPGEHAVIAENYYTRANDLYHPRWGQRFDRVRTALYDWPYKLIRSSPRPSHRPCTPPRTGPFPRDR